MDSDQQPDPDSSPDWNPAQYLKFSDHRLRPALELMARIPLANPSQVYDLGCGTGHITHLLAQRWPDARIVGIDNSAQMLERARGESSDIDWRLADIEEWSPHTPPSLIYSNAALHWVTGHDQLFPRLAKMLPTGGVLAVQMPLSWEQPSHQLMRQTLAEGGPGGTPLGTAMLRTEMDRKWVEETNFYYALLTPFCSRVDIWETEYLQILDGNNAVLEWVHGTGLRPIINELTEDELAYFMASYTTRLNAAYPPLPDGHTLYPFRRLFIVAQV